jgi:Transposase DDE domain
MLVLFDRGFFSYDFFAQAQATGADLLFRLSSTLKLPVLQRLPDDSYLSVITPKGVSTPTELGQARWLATKRQATLVRVVEYQVTDRDTRGEVYRLITTITDWQQALAPDLAAAYHQRWEFEIALDEIETHQIGHSRVLRSKSPEMVRQEIWGILLAHYAIRTLMTEAAHDATSTPTGYRSSDPCALFAAKPTAPRTFPPHQNNDTLRRVIDEILRHPLQPRRHRTYPRVIKRYGPCYRPIKRPQHREIRYPGPTTVEITAA